MHANLWDTSHYTDNGKGKELFYLKIKLLK